MTEVNRTWCGWQGHFQHRPANSFAAVDGCGRHRWHRLLPWRLDGVGQGIGAAHQRWPNPSLARSGRLSLATEQEWTRAIVPLSVVAKVRALRTGASVSLSSVRNGGEGWGEEALRNDDPVGMGGAPLSPALSPFVPHGARETDALLVTTVPARTFATTDTNPLTGEPEAGDPPVRFGGRGKVPTLVPSPIGRPDRTVAVSELFPLQSSLRGAGIAVQLSRHGHPCLRY